MKTGSSGRRARHVFADNDITLSYVRVCVRLRTITSTHPLQSWIHMIWDLTKKTKRASAVCQKLLLEIKYICIIVMYEWQASLFDNDNLSSRLTFKTGQKNCKIPFPILKTPAAKTSQWVFLTFYVKVNECCFD